MILYAASNKSTSDNIVFILPLEKGYIVLEKSAVSGNVEQITKCNALEEIGIVNQSTFYSMSNYFSILPTMSSNAISKNEIASFLGWKNSNENEIISSNILFSDSTILFQEDTSPIKKAITSVRIEHMANLLVPYALSQNWQCGICCLTIGNTTFLTLIKNGKFEVFNGFKVSNNEEILYYIMLFMQEFDLSQEDTVIDVFGEMQETPFLKEHLSNFLRIINIHDFVSIKDARISGLAQFISIQQ